MVGDGVGGAQRTHKLINATMKKHLRVVSQPLLLVANRNVRKFTISLKKVPNDLVDFGVKATAFRADDKFLDRSCWGKTVARNSGPSFSEQSTTDRGDDALRATKVLLCSVQLILLRSDRL
jgi:hypothetical protein